MKPDEKFEFLEHTADIKLRAFGSNINELFENVTLGISSYLSRNEKIKQSLNKEIEISSKDLQELLYKFSDELIYLLDAENFLVSNAKIKIKDSTLKAELFGDNSKNYEIDHIKAATYSEMEIKEIKNGWIAQIVLDV